MKVCVINSLYRPDSRGGAEITAEQQVEKYLKQGHEVFVVCTKVRRVKGVRRGSEAVEEIEGVKVYRLSARNLFSFYGYNNKPLALRLLWLTIDMFNFWQAGTVKKILLKERPEKVNTHNLRGLSYLVPRVIKSLKIKHLQTLHDIQLAYPSGLLVKGGGIYGEQSYLSRFFLRRWYESVCRWLFGSPAKIISPSQWLLDFYLRRGFFPKSKYVVRPPFKDFKLQIAGIKFIDKKLLKLLYVGQIEEHKGILFLIKALKSYELLITDYGLQAYELQIVGSGSVEDKVKNLIQDDPRFFYHGQISHEQVDKFYEAADITIVPSLTYENAPTVIFESLSHGTPVLASNLGGIPEFVREGENGWLFEAGDAEDLTNKLKSLITS